MSRDKTSRPNASVPSQCLAPGGDNMAPKSTVTGSYGASHGANAATSSMITTMPAPMAPSGRRRQNVRSVDTHREPGSAVGASDAMSIAGLMAIDLVPDPRVEPGVHQVHQEVDDDEDGRHEEHQSLGERVVSVGHRLDEEEAEAVQVEHLLGHHEPAHQ